MFYGFKVSAYVTKEAGYSFYNNRNPERPRRLSADDEVQERVYKCELNGKYWVDDSLTWSLEKVYKIPFLLGLLSNTPFRIWWLETTTFSLYQELREPISTCDLIFDDKFWYVEKIRHPTLFGEMIVVCTYRGIGIPSFARMIHFAQITYWLQLNVVIKRLYTLSTDVSYISHERFERKISPRGVHYYIVSYKVRMTLLNESWYTYAFTLSIMINLHRDDRSSNSRHCSMAKSVVRSRQSLLEYLLVVFRFPTYT